MDAPIEIKYTQKRNELKVFFADGQHAVMTGDWLRAHSPAADNQYQEGQMPEESVLIESIEPVGQYAIKIRFDDGHQSGIYSWETLQKLATQQASIQ